MQKHIVFDLDGTLSDTQKIHQRVESDFLKGKGVDIDPELIGMRYAGRTPQEWISEVLTSNYISFSENDLDDFVSEKDEIVVSLLKAGAIELMPYTFEILTYLNNKGYRIGISSGACREFIDEFIRHFHLEQIVLASTSANEVENKKPNPDVFLASFHKIEKIHGASSEKYVVGDGWSDVEGGYRAGARTVWLNYGKKPQSNSSYCNFEIESLKDLQAIL